MGAAAVSGCGFRGLRRADKQKQAKPANYAGRMHELDVLVVDDEADIRDLVAGILEDETAGRMLPASD